MVLLALRSALSDRAADGKIVIVDEWRFDAPKTKEAVAALNELGIEGRVLVVLGDGEHDAWKSFRNLEHAHCILATELNTYDVLVADYIVFTRATLPGEVTEAEASVAITSDDDTDDTDDETSDDDVVETDDAVVDDPDVVAAEEDADDEDDESDSEGDDE
jgi:large subunit ribosomal protein L4